MAIVNWKNKNGKSTLNHLIKENSFNEEISEKTFCGIKIPNENTNIRKKGDTNCKTCDLVRRKEKEWQEKWMSLFSSNSDTGFVKTKKSQKTKQKNIKRKKEKKKNKKKNRNKNNGNKK
jgi:hypothetical protein